MNFNNYFRSRQNEIVRFLKEIVARESPTREKKSVDACSTFVSEEFRKLGSRIQRFPQKDIGDLFLIEYPRPTSRAASEQILILTHIDTVWPVGKIVKMPFYISGEKIFGPGVLDMKAGLAMSLFALKALRELNLKPAKKIALFINSAEETGHEAAHDMIRKLARQSEAILCLEPALPGGGLKTERKGRLVMRLEVRGKAAHAGSPENGVNAIEELMGQLGRLKKIRTGGVTFSVDLIGGGEKANVVAENAWAVVDLRFWSSRQEERIRKFFKGMIPDRVGAKLKSSVESSTPPMEKTTASAKLLAWTRGLAADLGLTLTEGKAGGGSDASIASKLGLPTLDGLGPDGDGMHAENEHVLLPSLVERTALLTEILLQL